MITEADQVVPGSVMRIIINYDDGDDNDNDHTNDDNDSDKFLYRLNKASG